MGLMQRSLCPGAAEISKLNHSRQKKHRILNLSLNFHNKSSSRYTLITAVLQRTAAPQGVSISNSHRLCHGLITIKVSCAEVTHFSTQLCSDMNVWLTAKPVLQLNGLLLWLRLLFSSPTKNQEEKH